MQYCRKGTSYKSDRSYSDSPLCLLELGTLYVLCTMYYVCTEYGANDNERTRERKRNHFIIY